VPLPGAVELLGALTDLEIPWAIATSGRTLTAQANLRSLGISPETATIVTRDQVNYAKPDPDLFIEASRRLGTATQGSYVIGDSIWDMIASARCGALGIGLLSGGYGREELERAGALRVYDDPADMLLHLDELAPRTRD
jgi:phosphoglycolate phosphatase-like HAD superfamily hydrolase